MQNSFDNVLNDIRTRLSQRLQTLPHKVGAIVIAHSNQAFRDGGFTDEVLDPWTPRKNDKTPGRATLIKTGRLRRSIRIISAGPDRVVIGTDVPYAQVHNEGGVVETKERQVILNYSKDKNGKLHLSKVRTLSQQRRIKEVRRGTVYAHGYKMPQRKFLGNSHTQTKEIEKLIIFELQKALQK